VVSDQASWVFRYAPVVYAAALIGAAVLVPTIAKRSAAPGVGDAIVFAGLMALARFALALAALDTASNFGGMGASREVVVAALAEPTVILAIFALSLHAGTTNFGAIVERHAAEHLLANDPGHLLAFGAFFVVMIAETGRLPVDNPATHLELTMIHEAMVLEYSGRYLALIEWAAGMKLFVFLALLGNLFVPWGMPAAEVTPGILLDAIALAVKLALLGGLVALVESAVAKLRLFRVPELLSGSFVLAVLSVASFFVLR